MALMPPAPPPAVGESRTAYFAQLRIMRWLGSSGLDPNDPGNTALLELKKHRCATRPHSAKDPSSCRAHLHIPRPCLHHVWPLMHHL